MFARTRRGDLDLWAFDTGTMWDGVDIADGAVRYMNGQQPCGTLTYLDTTSAR